MDQTKVVVVLIVSLGGIVLAAMGYRFIADHWEDIKALSVVALVFGGTVTVAIGGMKMKSGRK